MIVKSVPLHLDKPRALRFDFNALSLIEEKTGKNALTGEVWESLDARTARIVLWAGLLADDPDLTIEKAGALLSLADLHEVLDAVRGAQRNQFPEPSADPQTAGGGMTSAG